MTRMTRGVPAGRDARAGQFWGPTVNRQEAAARTRESLLDAGVRLARTTGLAGLSVNRIVEEAGVSKGAFFHHFPDRASYLLVLHRDFHDRILAEARAVLGDAQPGADRLLRATRTYLDACLRERGCGRYSWRHGRSR